VAWTPWPRWDRWYHQAPRPRAARGAPAPQDVNVALIDQTGVIFAVAISVPINVALIDQTYAIFAIKTNVDIPVALINQTGTTFGTVTNVTIPEGLIDRTGAIFAISINATQNVPLIDRTGVIFAVTIDQGGDTNVPVGVINYVYTMYNVAVTPGPITVPVTLIDRTYSMAGVTEGGELTDFLVIEEFLDSLDSVCGNPQHHHYPHYPQVSDEHPIYYEPVRD